MDSIRESILDKLQTQLETIDAGTTYNYTINLVSRKFLDFEEVSESELPCISIVSGIMPISRLTNSQFTTGSPNGDDGWNVELYVLCKTNVDYNREGTLAIYIEKVIEDIRKCIETWKPSIDGFLFCYISSIEPYYDWKECIGSIKINLIIKFDWNKAT